MIPIVAEALRRWISKALMDRCEALGLPFAPIAKPWDLFEDKHLKASGGLVPVRFRRAANSSCRRFPLAMDGERLAQRRGVPAVGEHNAEILAEIGWDAPAACRVIVMQRGVGAT